MSSKNIIFYDNTGKQDKIGFGDALSRCNLLVSSKLYHYGDTEGKILEIVDSPIYQLQSYWIDIIKEINHFNIKWFVYHLPTQKLTIIQNGTIITQGKNNSDYQDIIDIINDPLRENCLPTIKSRKYLLNQLFHSTENKKIIFAEWPPEDGMTRSIANFITDIRLLQKNVEKKLYFDSALRSLVKFAIPFTKFAIDNKFDDLQNKIKNKKNVVCIKYKHQYQGPKYLIDNVRAAKVVIGTEGGVYHLAVFANKPFVFVLPQILIKYSKVALFLIISSFLSYKDGHAKICFVLENHLTDFTDFMFEKIDLFGSYAGFKTSFPADIIYPEAAKEAEINLLKTVAKIYNTLIYTDLQGLFFDRPFGSGTGWRS